MDLDLYLNPGAFCILMGLDFMVSAQPDLD